MTISFYPTLPYAVLKKMSEPFYKTVFATRVTKTTTKQAKKARTNWHFLRLIDMHAYL